MIDLRSDTVTQPTLAMRKAMARAEVGDDVYGEDPTVQQLEGLAAEMLGQESALFVSTGTLGNLCAVLTACKRGEEILVGDRSHLYHYENSGVCALGGVAFHPVNTTWQGELPLENLKQALRDPLDDHQATSTMLCLENTHNMCGGTAITEDYVKQASSWAHQNGLWVHLDGARLFNAAQALNVPVEHLARDVDSVTLCLSKGLSAPVGSVLAGERVFIQRARRQRKMLGGGMRQAGVLAAAGLVALREMVQRLQVDHGHAQAFASQLQVMPGVRIDMRTVQTNMVHFQVDAIPSTVVIQTLKGLGLLVSESHPGVLRAVFHPGITDQHLEKALVTFSRALERMYKQASPEKNDSATVNGVF